MVRLLNGLWLTLCLVTCCVLTAQADEPGVKLRIEPDPPPATESFTLVFEARGAVDADPDFSPLEEHFEILGRNQQTSLQIVNGKRTRSTVWMLNVLPKHGAPLTVPAVRFGKLATPAREITFASPTNGTADADEGLFLEVDAQPATPYVQQQVIYSLRLWRRYEISNASLSEPELSADAIVKPIDADRRYEATRDGKRYEVIERRFAIFPQTSGAVTIKPAVVTAQVVKRGFSLFDSFSQPVATKRIVSAAVELDVRPIPKDFPGATWLPARQLSLNEDWQPAGTRAKVGEPLTRTLNLWADGLTAGQLPPLEMADVAGLKLYPDRPQTSEQQQDTGYSAVLQRKTAIIPVEAGELRLPEIEIPWWNTTTDALEIARVPATTLTSDAAPGLEPAPPAESAEPATDVPAAPPAPAAPVVTTTAVPTDFWPMLALVTTAGWLLTLALWWRRPGATPPAAATAAGELPALSALTQAVNASFASADARTVATALLRWAAARWPAQPPRSLGALAGRVDAPLAQALWSLDRALYQADASRVDLAPLQQAWSTHLAQRVERTASSAPALPPLYASAR